MDAKTPDPHLAEFHQRLTQQKHRNATMLAAGLLLVFMMLLFFALPSHLPWFVQKLVAIVNALLATVVVVFAARQFRKRTPAGDQTPSKSLDLGMVGGGAAFLAVMAWWLSPWPPIRVEIPAAADISAAFTDELTLAALVMPDAGLAMIEIPTPPPFAVAQARQIPNDADSFSLLVKAIAEGRYSDATELADRAEKDGVDPALLAITRGQLAIFSANYSAAPAFFATAVQAKADPAILGQTAVAWALAGRFDKAYEAANQLVEKARADSGTNPNALPTSLNIKAAIALSSGRFKESLKLTEEAQQFWDSSADATASGMAHRAASRNNQAVAYALLPTKYAGAETLLGGAIQFWTDSYGGDSIHLATAHINLGMLAITQSRFDVAEKQLTQSLEIARRVASTQNPGWAAPLNASARLNTILARFENAKKLAADAKTAAAKAAPLLELANLAARGAIAAGQGEYSESVSQYQRAQQLATQLLPPDHIYQAELLSQFADANSRRGRFPETEPACRRAIEIIDKQLGENHPLAARAYDTLGYNFLRADDKSAARKPFETAARILKLDKTAIGTSAETARNLAGSAALFSPRQQAEAIRAYDEAIKIDTQVYGPALGAKKDAPFVEIPSTADYLLSEAALLAADDSNPSQATKAAELYEQAISIRTKLLPNQRERNLELEKRAKELRAKAIK